ncbi:MAG: TetR/AcrR family transcriptional regulator [Caulobacteraceae bacterium]
MRVKTDEKRRAILRAAAELVREQGFAGVSMAAVSERVGGSKATLYRYYASKEELFLAALLESALDRAGKVFETLAAGPDLRRTLDRFGTDYLKLALAPDVLAVRRILIAEGARSGIGQSLFERGPQVTWTTMADFLAAEMAAGRLRAADPWTVAVHLRGLLEADLLNRALVGADVDRRVAHLRAHAARAVDVLLRAYAPENQPQAEPMPSAARETPPSTGMVAPTT